MFNILLTQRARKDLKTLGKTPFYTHVVKKINELKRNPFEGDVKQLKTYIKAGYRKRVGNYRILFDIDVNNRIIYILRIHHRKDAYKK